MNSIEYTIEKKTAFKLVGFKDNFYFKDKKEDFEGMSKKWENFSEDKMNKLFPLMDGIIQGFLGVVEILESEIFSYTIAVSSNKECVEDLHRITVPELKWLVFPCVGAIYDKNSVSAMIKLKNSVLHGWLETQGFEQAAYPRIEVYPQGDMGSNQYESALWIPIIEEREK